MEVEGKNQLRFQVLRQPYYPTAIHKTLIKMALVMMPDDDHRQFDYLKSWLLSKNHKPGLSGTVPVIEWEISGGVNPNKITCIVAKVREASQESTYRYQFIFQYGNFQYQFVIPLPEECGHDKDFVYAPVFLPDEHFRIFGPSDYQVKHFNSSDREFGENSASCFSTATNPLEGLGRRTLLIRFSVFRRRVSRVEILGTY